MNYAELYYYSLLDENSQKRFAMSSNRASIVENYLSPLNDEQKNIFYNNVNNLMWMSFDDKLKWYYINLSSENRQQLINFSNEIIEAPANIFWNSISDIEKNYFLVLNDYNKKMLGNYTRDQIIHFATEYYNTISAQQNVLDDEILRRAEEDKNIARMSMMSLIPGFTEEYMNILEEKKYNTDEVLETDITNDIIIDTSKSYDDDRLTKYEVALLVGKRARMLDQNAIPTVNPGDLYDSVKIATLELKSRRLPLNLSRKSNNGIIISKNPNKMSIPAEILNPDYILTYKEKNDIIQKRTKEFEDGIKPIIDPRKIAFAELLSGLLNVNGHIPEDWNIDKLNNIEIDEIIEMRIKQLESNESTILDITYDIPYRDIAHLELKKGVIPIEHYQRINGEVVNPNLMLLPSERIEGILTNDEVRKLSKNENITVNQLNNKELDKNIIRDGILYNIKGWEYPHKIRSIEEILSWFDVIEIINDRTKQLSIGNKSYIPYDELAMMELKYGLTPGLIKRDKDFIQLNNMLVD